MKRLINIFCFLTILAAVSAAVPNYYQLMTDYCQIECPPGAKHIGCKSNGTYAAKCNAKNVTMVPITDSLKIFLTVLHNEKRNITAGGLGKEIPPACHMSPMRWSDELAYLAGLSVERCGSESDECRNTETFHNAGQNVYDLGLPKALGLDDQQAIKFALDDWYKQKKNCKGCIRQKYSAYYSQTPIIEFMTLVLEDNTHFGCATGTFIRHRDEIEHALVCNYATSIEENQPVYKGCRKPAEKCKRRHHIFKNLCTLKKTHGIRNVKQMS